MLNIEEIVQRIQQLISDHGLNASSFADTIGVQRSSISHILSGRNKPSLDFLARIEENFEEVNFLWLLKGEPSSTPPPKAIESKAPTATPSETLPETKLLTKSMPSSNSPSTIVHYYADGSFEVYTKR